MDFTTLVRLRTFLTIKHHIPGRMRIRFDTGLLQNADAQQVLRQVEAARAEGCAKLPRGVSSAEVNPLARSVTVEYDPAVVAPELLEALVAAPDEAGAMRAFNALRGLMDDPPAASA